MSQMKIYVASSWRNNHQPQAVEFLRSEGFSVYDFKKEDPFRWSSIDPDWEDWSTKQYIHHLDHSLARKGFRSDHYAMCEADACVLVMPAGRSACLEAGWFAGSQRPLAIWLPERVEPELMFKMAGCVSPGLLFLAEWLRKQILLDRVT
ncbi:MAG: hypothetical protein V3R83_09865 [Gammaproteobacteria bacterium]